jgi:poly(glycerol-phosphate) alpha-glucosyltransferase
MLDSWALGRSAWKKRVAASLFEDTNLRSAACIHALCESEAESIRAYGLSNPIAVLPNGVDVTSFASLPACDALWQRFPELRDKKVILFLGRLHPKKGPLHLIEGWSRVAGSFPDWHLLISGPDEIGHQAVLEDTSKARGIANRITFAGAVVGRDKLAALAAADVFVLPSLSEGFSVALLEAMACRLPAIITPPCNFPEAIAAGAAIEVQPDAESTAAGLVHVMEMSGAARRQCGLRGYELVAANYTWEGIAQEMTDVYSWCLGGGSPPKAIRLN